MSGQRGCRQQHRGEKRTWDPSSPPGTKGGKLGSKVTFRICLNLAEYAQNILGQRSCQCFAGVSLQRRPPFPDLRFVKAVERAVAVLAEERGQLRPGFPPGWSGPNFEPGGGLLRHFGKTETDKVIGTNVLL